MSDCECIIEAATILAKAISGVGIVLLIGIIFGAFRS